MASIDSRVQATHVILVGMGQQDTLDHVAAHSVAFELGKGLIEGGDILAFGVFLLAVVLDRLAYAGIDEDAAARCSQVGTVTAAAAAQAHKAQPLAHTRIARRGRCLLGLLHQWRVVAVHVKCDLEWPSRVGVSFIFVS